ncbi:hypothetical protein [Paucibacter soli]|uniref:hypothetical protein n=1 Tax=Paucibacter soli TaxID=3133433 RepID=UPI0030B39A0A
MIITADTFVHVLSLCIVLAGAETLHGIARTLLLVPRIGKQRAIKLSALTGSLLALLICLALVPAIGLSGVRQHLLLGLVLALFMAGFDLAIGKLLLRKSWSKLWPDFDPRSGNYLSLGLAFLVWAPLLASWLRA